MLRGERMAVPRTTATSIIRKWPHMNAGDWYENHSCNFSHFRLRLKKKKEKEKMMKKKKKKKKKKKQKQKKKKKKKLSV